MVRVQERKCSQSNTTWLNVIAASLHSTASKQLVGIINGGPNGLATQAAAAAAALACQQYIPVSVVNPSQMIFAAANAGNAAASGFFTAPQGQFYWQPTGSTRADAAAAASLLIQQNQRQNSGGFPVGSSIGKYSANHQQIYSFVSYSCALGRRLYPAHRHFWIFLSQHWGTQPLHMGTIPSFKLWLDRHGLQPVKLGT